MRPKLLLHVFPTFAVGGAQTRFAAIANQLGDRFRHAVIALDGDTACREKLDPALDLTFPPFTAPRGDTVAAVRAARACLLALRPNVLITSNWGSIEWVMANAVRVARHIHTEDGFGPDEQSTQIKRRVLTRRLFLRRSDVVLPSRTLLRIATHIWRLPKAQRHYIPNGIDLARFVPRTAPRDGVPVIGSIAGLRPEKNLARLLHAFRIVRDAMPARLVLVGDGLERPALEALAVSLGLADDVVFAGHVAAPERALADFDIFALSSDTEQMPLSVLEAMASGLPVASTDVGDIASMVATENSVFVTPKDEAALAEVLLRLARDPALRGRIGAANRARAERDYGEAAMVRAYASLFER